MNIPLDQFEQIIDDTILKRGLQYFRKGLVEEPEELSHGEFEAIVLGSEPYRVTVTIRDGEVTNHTCSCPYDMGPVCKHVVAVLFVLQEESLGLLERYADRNHYQEATRYIRRMKKIGAASHAEELIKELQGKYPMRKALMEELAKV
jgi:uncharacterized Zn finger protein